MKVESKTIKLNSKYYLKLDKNEAIGFIYLKDIKTDKIILQSGNHFWMIKALKLRVRLSKAIENDIIKFFEGVN